MAAILDFNRKWIFFRLPPYLKLKILLKTMFVPSFMLVPQKAVFFDILQLSAGLAEDFYASENFTRLVSTLSPSIFNA